MNYYFLIALILVSLLTHIVSILCSVNSESGVVTLINWEIEMWNKNSLPTFNYLITYLRVKFKLRLKLLHIQVGR